MRELAGLGDKRWLHEQRVIAVGQVFSGTSSKIYRPDSIGCCTFIFPGKFKEKRGQKGDEKRQKNVTGDNPSPSYHHQGVKNKTGQEKEYVCKKI
jgi:hypothetical protein